MSRCFAPSREADDKAFAWNDISTHTHSAAGRIWGKSRDSRHDEMIGRWESPVYSKLFCEAWPKLSTEQEKRCLMGHFLPNYPEEGEQQTQDEAWLQYTVPIQCFTAPSCGQPCTRWPHGLFLHNEPLITRESQYIVDTLATKLKNVNNLHTCKLSLTWSLTRAMIQAIRDLTYFNNIF